MALVLIVQYECYITLNGMKWNRKKKEKKKKLNPSICLQKDRYVWKLM